MVNKYGFSNRLNWVLYKHAPLTASGLNEILIATHTRNEAERVAKFLGLKVSLNGQYRIAKLKDITIKEEESNG